jgi:hypothetical protein
MGLRCVASVLLACIICAEIALEDEHLPATFDDPAKVGLMKPAAKSQLDACVAQAGQSAGDGQERRVMAGVFIGSKGRPVSLAILESSGLEHLDKLVLRCLFRANYTPAAPGKPPIQWIFKSLLEPKRPKWRERLLLPTARSCPGRPLATAGAPDQRDGQLGVPASP